MGAHFSRTNMGRVGRLRGEGAFEWQSIAYEGHDMRFAALAAMRQGPSMYARL